MESPKETDEFKELKSRWPLFEVLQTEKGYMVILPESGYFNLTLGSSYMDSVSKEIDRLHGRATTDLWLKSKFPFLDFYGVQVSCKGIKLDYEIVPDKLEESVQYLANVNAEAELVSTHPDNYTMCSYCHCAVPHDYVAFKKTGVCCRSCADIKGKVLC